MAGKLTLEFEDVVVEVGFNNDYGRRLANLLFCDLQTTDNEHGKAVKRYDILAAGTQPMLSVWESDKLLYHGDSPYDLAYALVNEVLYNSIVDNSSHHALHAAAVHKNGKGIILPGISGRGKSTFTALLCSNGFGYLTDELIFLSESGEMTPFTRPINLKTKAPIITDEFYAQNKDEIILAETGGSMIPHRLLNKHFTSTHATVSYIIFPEYRERATFEFTELSSAKSCFSLLQCHVNARNLPSLGMETFSGIVRNCKSYSLVYSDFDDAKKALAALFR